MPYACANCRRLSPVFSLLCTECGAWNSLRPDDAPGARPVALSQIGGLLVPRTKTGIVPLDELLGDGLVPGSSVLLTGPPGAGKSTLVMQMLKKMNVPSLHVTGEESVRQLKVRADRLKFCSRNAYLMFETNVQKIVRQAGAMEVLVIDSIQTVYTDTCDALPGSPTQIRKCAYILRRLAQEKNLILVLVGQVTKDRKAAGPRLLEHAV